MHLRKIKLAGFKSFVDPTTVQLPSNLIGIVGPNGCGKSNIIDCVRWVMGESSAKHLRGDSMTDVIFNGSTSRKPVGQAAVELVFDNSDGRLGGQYAAYNEISVKRSVSRDGVSNYHLNGTRCRRKDVTDVFLGTGLGPRSYAIIEQGTISRLIEAKPEDLRVFLEEAAGISKYKERRRETETRIKHTRENLDRLNDLRDELEKQLAHLNRQAKTAERYKILKEEERLLQAQLQALRWQSLNGQSAGMEAAIRDKETALEAGVAKQRSIEADIEKQREAHTEANDRFNQVQSRFYSVGSEIARMEQSIQHAKERRTQQQKDLAQIDIDWKQAETHLQTDRERIAELERSIGENTPALTEVEGQADASTANLNSAEQAMQEWQAEWEKYNSGAAEPARRAEVERTRIAHIEQQSMQLQQRSQRLQEELKTMTANALQEQSSQLEQRLQESESHLKAKQEALQQVLTEMTSLRETSHKQAEELDKVRRSLQDMSGRHTSLEALQQAALGQEQGAVIEWLRGQQLEQAPRLAQQLEVESGWEGAVECVLGGYLEAVCLEDGVDPLKGVLDSLEGSLSFFDVQANHAAATASNGTPLLDKVKAPWKLDGLLGGVYAAEGLNEALAQRTRLAAHESIVTRDGIWLGPDWLRVVRAQDEKAGILQREQEMKSLKTQLASQEQTVSGLQQTLEQERSRLRDLEAQREDMQAGLNQSSREHAKIETELKSLRERIERARTRQQQLQNDLQEIQNNVAKGQQELTAARESLQTAVEEMATLDKLREALQGKRTSLRETLDQARQRYQADREKAQNIKLRMEAMRAELQSKQQGMQRMEAQLQQLSVRRDELNKAIAGSDTPIATMAADLEKLLARRVEVENELAEARAALQAIEHLLRELEEARGQAEQSVQDVRSALEQARMNWQETKVRRQTLEERVRETGYELKALLDEMPEEAEEQKWAESVEEMERKIQRLGPINLAAIEEYEQQSERKKYLDAQNADLMEALETLENAIKKIDRETRTRFQETYDKVNSGLQELFPRLFGGGHAYLEMTSEDLLETGVTIMARPPGKRNSTIHLLSGGEKALTAVALVFSLFELNPAPFCMLDEVDAPLDDANVGRYCDMLRAMSDRTQFIFITHNKITMEVANHLTGVTMHEPGVSRLVSVDVDEAVQLAAV